MGLKNRVKLPCSRFSTRFIADPLWSLLSAGVLSVLMRKTRQRIDNKRILSGAINLFSIASVILLAAPTGETWPPSEGANGSNASLHSHRSATSATCAHLGGYSIGTMGVAIALDGRFQAVDLAFAPCAMPEPAHDVQVNAGMKNGQLKQQETTLKWQKWLCSAAAAPPQV